MSYSVKVNFGQNLSIECFGDEIKIVTQLLNETTNQDDVLPKGFKKDAD